MESKHAKKKILKYVKRNDLSKFASYVRRNHIDCTNIRLKHGNTLLHVACKHGSDVIIRHLLKLGADILVSNKYGQLPIHLACQYASYGHLHAETDVVLPIVKACSRCLDVSDLSGTTARQMLQNFKERMKQKQLNESDSDLSSSEDEGSCADLEEMWYKRLQSELEDECSSSWDSFERDFGADERSHETFDGWADRMSSEYSRRRPYGETLPPVHRNSTRRESPKPTADRRDDTPKIAEHKRKEFERKMTAAQREHAHHITVRRKLKYEGDCASLYRADSSSVIGFDDVPWPCLGNASVVSTDELSRDAVVGFLFGDLNVSSTEYKSYLRVQRVRWHPDRFAQRCGQRLVATHRDRILRRVKEISQILNELHRQLEK